MTATNEFSPAFSAAFDADDDPCAWPIDASCAQEEWEAFSPEVQQRASALAVATLRRLSGYRVGGCPIVVRPCVRSCRTSTFMALGPGWGPTQLADGTWVNSCGCQTDCACTALCEVRLAPPVVEVLDVVIDGESLPEGSYRADGGMLVWIGDGECPWPACQDMTAPLTEPDTFGVRYRQSHAPDALAQYAAGVLAVEFAKACTGGKCRLPANVTQVTRQGVSFEIAAGTFGNGFTNIREVDAWIGLWNPGAMRQASQVWFPGQRYPRLVGQ